jgi:LmbE family N-acetylglucosaminyl deacetylase
VESIIRDAKRPAIVIAHPDDEALWFSGAPIRYPGNWLIVCCTVPFKDPERIGKFQESCNALGAKSFRLDHGERDGLIPFGELKSVLGDRDLIITHGPLGEYGHVQHKEVHQGIRNYFLNALMWATYNDTARFTLELTDAEWARKLEILKCYNGKTHWERLLEYYGTRFPLRREPYAISTELLNAYEHGKAGSGA